MIAGFLSLGFRPFFLGAGLWACIAMAVWLTLLAGGGELPSAFGPSVWHGHELIFGYAAAVIAGFALTAVPNWTGRRPVQGAVLAALFALWIAGRVAVAVSAAIGPLAAALIDGAFLLVLCGVVTWEIIAAGNRRNLVIAAAIALLFAANVAVHAGALGYEDAGAIGLRGGLAIVIVLITLIGGRVTPAFTGNWLRGAGAEKLPKPFGPIDGAALATGALGLGGWAVFPEHVITAVLLLLAGVLHGLRVARWRGGETLSEPLVWILHLGYAWVPVGLFILGLAYWLPVLAGGVALHALTVGAVGTMTLAVMTRATLGHTGRPLAAGGGTVMVYLSVMAAAGLRLATGIVPDIAGPLIFVSGGLWIAGFGLFVLLYGPMHLSKPI